VAHDAGTDVAPIRLATVADAATIGRLCADLGAELGNPSLDPVTLADRAAYLMERQLTTFFVAGDPAAGLAQLRLRPSIWTGGADAYLENLYVAVGARRRGFGKRLLSAAVEYARESGALRVEIATNEADAAAARLYGAAGFASWHPRSESRILLYVRRLEAESAD